MINSQRGQTSSEVNIGISKKRNETRQGFYNDLDLISISFQIYQKGILHIMFETKFPKLL